MKNRILILMLSVITLFACSSDSLNNNEVNLSNQKVDLQTSSSKRAVTKNETQSFTIEQAEKLLSPLKNSNYEFKEVAKSEKSENAETVTKTIKFHSSSGTFELVYPSTECPDEVQVLITGDGNATHLGHFTVKNTYCSDFSQNPTSPIKGLLTAANGDTINTMVVGIAYNPEVGFIYDYIVLSGSGRFEGVTGYITMYGVIDEPNFFWSLKGEGQITY